MFSYFLARPSKETLLDLADIARFEREENQREELANRRGGVYSLSDYFYMICHGFYLDHINPRIARFRRQD